MLDLIVLDVGLRLGDLDAYYGLPRETQIDLRAYWRVRVEMKADDARRFAFLTPIPRDFLPVPRTLRVVDGSEYEERTSGRRAPSAPAAARPPGWTEATGSAVTIYDAGQARPATPAEAAAIEPVKRAKFREHWAQETGSSPAAIDWWLNSEA